MLNVKHHKTFWQKREHNIDLQNSGSKRKYNDPPNLDIDDKNSRSKRQRQMTMEPRGWPSHPQDPLGVVSATLLAQWGWPPLAPWGWSNPNFFLNVFFNKKNKLHDMWRDSIGPHFIFVKSTNNQRTK